MHSELICSICAILIALTSLAVAIWHGSITRKHNILSVKPLPDILVSNYRNRIAISIENNGIGPLIIKNFRAYVGDESKSNLIDWMPHVPDGCDLSYHWLRDFEK